MREKEIEIKDDVQIFADFLVEMVQKYAKELGIK